MYANEINKIGDSYLPCIAMAHSVLNLISIQGYSGQVVKYAIHLQNEVKQCMRSLVQSLVKPITWKY
jgi:hypothetical protein